MLSAIQLALLDLNSDQAAQGVRGRVWQQKKGSRVHAFQANKFGQKGNRKTDNFSQKSRTQNMKLKRTFFRLTKRQENVGPTENQKTVEIVKNLYKIDGFQS